MFLLLLVDVACGCTIGSDCKMTCASRFHVACINHQCGCHDDHGKYIWIHRHHDKNISYTTVPVCTL